ncbi:glutathione S- transferase, nitrogen catabolite repression regulator [Pseudocyphellaria aurata]|nr:glutathione S- transferase, nitrogen catabolite repression regulator [Pseudocyphellaria aurata]
MAAQPITLYTLGLGPNPFKVAMVLEELEIPYELVRMEKEDVKKEPFTKLNPNGRVPAIEDPNTGIVLWESGAIIEYLIDQYDPSAKLSFTSFPEKYHAKQWLHFQMSGQGPYFGQAAWFTRSHPEKIPSAIERYRNEIRRVTMVLDHALQGKQYLVGDKCSYADLSFVVWSNMMPYLFGDEKLPDFSGEYPSYHAWLERLNARPAVQKVLQIREAEASVNGPSKTPR